jgi:hypothetical protein
MWMNGLSGEERRAIVLSNPRNTPDDRTGEDVILSAKTPDERTGRTSFGKFS